MTVETAVEIMKEAYNVQVWNALRDHIKSKVTQIEWLKYYVPAIDASGLIVQVLGKDSINK